MKLDRLQTACALEMKRQNFDALAVGVVDLREGSYTAFELTCSKHYYYDLASVTKPLTLASTYLTRPDIFDADMKLLLCHEAGLPAWGLLSKKTWRDQLLSYLVKKSVTLYSDFSALRTMLEIEKNIPSLHEHCKTFWDREVCFWRDLPVEADCPETGVRDGKVIRGVVHDPNAYTIGSFCSHAGLFGTIDGVCRTILNLEKHHLCDTIIHEHKNRSDLGRFVLGWDRSLDPETTLAGKGRGPMTFGHLGFTGTSIWIDPEMKKGVVVLSNATQHYWYAKDGLNRIRRACGTFTFTGDL